VCSKDINIALLCYCRPSANNQMLLTCKKPTKTTLIDNLTNESRPFLEPISFSNRKYFYINLLVKPGPVIGCRADDDCPGREACYNGRCTESLPKEPIEAETPCPAGFVMKPPSSSCVPGKCLSYFLIQLPVEY